MKRDILILTACIMLPVLLSAQSLNKAQKLMDKYNYSGAVEVLKKASNVAKLQDEATQMLAECYRMQHDILNTKLTYAKVVEQADAPPLAFFYYGQALQSTGDYAKAKATYQQYAAKCPTDSKVKQHIAQCDSVLSRWNNLNPGFEVKLVNNINTAGSDFGPSLYEGWLTFTTESSISAEEMKEYGWTGRGYLDLKGSRPLVQGDYWGEMGPTMEFESAFNQEYHDGPATFSADGNTIYLTRSYFGKALREGIYKTNKLKIYYASKNNGAWGELQPFYLNSIKYSVGHPALSPDGKVLYFASDMPGGYGETDIWMCKRENESWGPAINLGSTVNTAENEMFPGTSPDGALYFSSDGHTGYGALDIFKTTYENGKWTSPVNLYAPVNGSYDDFAIAFEPGAKSGFFSSNRIGGIGNDDIYTFRLPEPPAPVLPAYISGLVKDKTTLQPIAGATVFLYNAATGKIKILKTGADGMYKMEVENTADYTVKAMMPLYIADCTPFAVTEVVAGKTSMAPRDLLLDKLSVDKTFRIENIYYDFDKYNIRADAKPELDKLVLIMKENAIDVELGSHTDSRGSFAYNEKLSQNRAESAVKYIVSSGIQKNRIAAKGYGENKLTNQCADGVKCSAAEHQANRRTEFKVTGVNGAATLPDQFDGNKYTDGQELEINTFPANFFNPCK